MHWDEILWRCDSIEYYLDYLLLNSVAFTTQEWWTLEIEMDASFETIADLDEISYGDDDTEGDIDSILLRLLAQPFQNGGRLNF
jgi:hypothetical protein